jgi:uncharacterized protein
MTENVLFRKDLFKETPEGLVLVGNKCAACGRVFFPKVDFCTECLNETMEEITLSKRGTLYSYTITRVPLGKFPIPHALGFITLPEKVRIFAPLIISEKEFQVGDTMEMEIVPLWTEPDKNVLGYKFKSVTK